MKRIVILGGGFAGVAVAHRLEKKLRRDEAEIAVGEGEKQEIGRRLSEIDGRFGFVERSLFRTQKMHGSGLLAR